MNKKGVSLLVMVITTLTMMLIAGAVILNLIDHNPLEESKKTKIQVDIKNYTLDLDTYIKSKMQEDIDFDESEVNATNLADIKKIIPNFKDEYEKYICILEGEIRIKEDSIRKYPKETAWVSEVGIKNEKDYRIPSGFVYVEGEKDTGIVIRDEINGNEFVWVPVDNPLDFVRRDSLVKVNISQTLTNSILKDEEEESPNFAEFKNSVIKNGGFYIGRYETSAASNGNYRVLKNTSPESGLLTNTNMNNGKLKANLLYENNKDVKSSLLFATAYDYVMKWTGNVNQADSKGKGQYSGPAILTGSSETYKVNNIYDLAGNYYEATLETSNNNPVFRGGSYATESTMTMMSRNATAGIKGNARLVLYFK